MTIDVPTSLENVSPLKPASFTSLNEYQTDRYEQERFTDTYTEDFEDDYDKGDRFTDDYHEKFTD